MPTLRATPVDPRDGPAVSVGVEVPLEATAGQAFPDLPGEPMFLLYWRPGLGCYGVRSLSDGTPVLVPRIQYLRGAPGVGDVSGDPALDFSIAVAKIVKAGGVALDAATCRKHRLPSYLRAHTTSRVDGNGNRGLVHLPPWRFPHRGRSGAWEIETDEDQKTRWEEALLQQGIIPAPEAVDLQAIMDGRNARIARHVNRATEKDKLAYDLERRDQVNEELALRNAGFIVDDLEPEAKREPPPSIALPEVALPLPPPPAEPPAPRKAPRG